MDFEDSAAEAHFRAEVRTWLLDHADRKVAGAPPSGKSLDERITEAKCFQARKAARGYAAITWPKAVGGLGGSEIEAVIYRQEESEFDVESHHFFGIGVRLCAGTVLKCGDEAQKRRYLPKALSGEEIWCQLFSEPACGSDLAAVRTRARKTDDGWVIKGQKVWTTGGHFSDYGLLLARTDPAAPKHKGLTMFIVDMRALGVDVRPIRQMSGQAEFNEVFLDDVQVSDAMRVGPENSGWQVALTTLGLERAVAGVELAFVDWRQLLRIARTTNFGGLPALADGRVRERIAECWLSTFGVRLMTYRTQTALGRGVTPGPEQSLAKLILAPQGQKSAIAAMDILREAGALTHADLGGDWAHIETAWTRSATYRIAGGTDEILRNILAERVLGLPQDARVDRDIPFSELDALTRQPLPQAKA
jgi:alkylation response protein AidB-like acyl-CoA dehydrogenase